MTKVLTRPDTKEFIFTGHSQGGAIALLLAYQTTREMRISSDERKVTLNIFGTPRVLNNHASEELHNLPNFSYKSFMYMNDIVPRILFETDEIKNNEHTSYRAPKYTVYFNTRNYWGSLFKLLTGADYRLTVVPDTPWAGTVSHILYGVLDHSFVSYVKACTRYRDEIARLEY